MTRRYESMKGTRKNKKAGPEKSWAIVEFLFLALLMITSPEANSQWSLTYRSNSNGYDYFGKPYFTSLSTGYITLGDSSIIKTTNGGQNWFSLNGTSGYGLQDIQFTSPSRGYAVGY